MHIISMSTENKGKKGKTVPESPFREYSVDATYNVTEEDHYHPDAIDHFRRIPKEQRSHEDYDELLKILKVLEHGTKFKDQELWMSHKRIFGFTEANANLIALNRRLARILINDAEGHNENMMRVITDYRRAILGKVVDVSLNGNSFTFTRAHMVHLCEWYTMGGMFIFKRGEKFMGAGDDYEGTHKYQFGEIVERTYFSRDKKKCKEEVIVFAENKYIADVVTASEIRRVGQSQKDGFTIPRFVSTIDLKAHSPRKFLLPYNKMVELVHELM